MMISGFALKCREPDVRDEVIRLDGGSKLHH